MSDVAFDHEQVGVGAAHRRRRAAGASGAGEGVGPRRSGARRLVPTGIDFCRSGTSSSKWTVRVLAKSADGARRAIVGRSGPVPVVRTGNAPSLGSPARPRRSRPRSAFAATLRVLRSTIGQERSSRADAQTRPGRLERVATSPRERRTQNAVVHFERAAEHACACSASSCAWAGWLPARSLCSASFGDTKPPSNKPAHARRLARKGPSGAPRGARACIATA